MMNSETITAENFSEIEFDDNFFKFCKFEALSLDGGVISSVFQACTFKDLDWYWGLLMFCNFIECRFENCVFRGGSFPDCRFIECTFTNVRFVKDNLDGPCNGNSIAYGSIVENCEGLESILR